MFTIMVLKLDNNIDGRYTWRHDKVLDEIAATIDMARRKKRTVRKGPTFINFVSNGIADTRTHSGEGLLSTADDWEMQAVLKKQTQIPTRDCNYH
jgi:hypothetical protein